MSADQRQEFLVVLGYVFGLCRSALLRSGLRQQGMGALSSLPGTCPHSRCSFRTVPGHYQPRLAALCGRELSVEETL